MWTSGKINVHPGSVRSFPNPYTWRQDHEVSNFNWTFLRIQQHEYHVDCILYLLHDPVLLRTLVSDETKRIAFTTAGGPSQYDLSHLLYCAAIANRKAILEYLLEIGANPNDKANGGSSALETALWHMSFGRLDPLHAKRLRPQYQLSGALDCVRVLLA